jgi:hypothetical protein
MDFILNLTGWIILGIIAGLLGILHPVLAILLILYIFIA